MTFGEKFWYYVAFLSTYFIKVAVKKALLEGLTLKAQTAAADRAAFITRGLAGGASESGSGSTISRIGTGGSQ
jgi:hypothetical protein